MVAFYLRLSKADGEEEESNSIGMQRELLWQSLGRYGLSGEEVVEYVERKTLNLIQSVFRRTLCFVYLKNRDGIELPR